MDDVCYDDCWDVESREQLETDDYDVVVWRR